ncbi:hypothetical protein JTB14_032784 [Gonioctena quinquepunctata]|nr:hypothetical protein JTB14_032784 [Gonioctena quinquepunctata]
MPTLQQTHCNIIYGINPNSTGYGDMKNEAIKNIGYDTSSWDPTTNSVSIKPICDWETPQLLRGLIDHGSRISLITEEAAQKLG